MAVIFPRWTNRVPLAVALVAPIVALGAIGAVWYWFSPWFTDVGYEPKQPVPFSHELHAGQLGMDCRYCHNTVERAGHAAIPPTATCYGCHSVIKAESRVLEPIRRSAVTGEPVYEPDPNDPTKPVAWGWVKVHLLPDYSYFDHSVHVSAGVGCADCHGRIDQMEIVKQVEPLSMGWCLDCHREPEPNLRPRDQVTNMSYEVSGGWDYTAPSTPEWGCTTNQDCESGFCDPTAVRQMSVEGQDEPVTVSGVCIGREVNPPLHCSGCHR